MLGNQCLVGSNNMLAMMDCCQNQVFGGGMATNQFNDNINVRVAGDIKDIPGDMSLVQNRRRDCPDGCPTCSIMISLPARAAMLRAFRVNTLKVPLPTVPSPQIPTLTGFKMFTLSRESCSEYLLLLRYCEPRLLCGLKCCTESGYFSLMAVWTESYLCFRGNAEVRL